MLLTLYKITNTIFSDAKQKKTFFLNKKVLFFIFYNLKKGKDISILWRVYSVIHIICCIIQAVKHYMNCIYIDSHYNNFDFY